MTAYNMRNAFGGESAAHMRYVLFSERADLEKFPNIARLFRALAFAEKVHASSHYRQAQELLGEFTVTFTTPFIFQRTVDNLNKSAETENFESEELYPAYAAVASSEKDMRAAQNFGWLAQVEKIHGEFLRRVYDIVQKEAQEPVLGPLYVCDICGHLVESEPPESCPVCKAKKFRFRLIG
jgi:rubrerythrin